MPCSSVLVRSQLTLRIVCHSCQDRSRFRRIGHMTGFGGKGHRTDNASSADSFISSCSPCYPGLASASARATKFSRLRACSRSVSSRMARAPSPHGTPANEPASDMLLPPDACSPSRRRKNQCATHQFRETTTSHNEMRSRTITVDAHILFAKHGH
jgi:hypothetical protein